jgi:cytochrome bd-type quinol oxidase subunit 2
MLCLQALSQLAKEALLAIRIIYPAVRVTELRKSPWLSSQGNVHLKLENGQASPVKFDFMLVGALRHFLTMWTYICTGYWIF